RDNGSGIPAEEQARLFTQFTRLDEAQAKGHGLGLSIVRRIVSKLGGEVDVESQVGQGSVFGFSLTGVQVEGDAVALEKERNV
ncbi:MAG: sensor histidine kinase, partial [Chloroflexi bacterium]|nr:sensor histidine kinase [Chloroflexota bacterium]